MQILTFGIRSVTSVIGLFKKIQFVIEEECFHEDQLTRGI